MRNTTSLKSFGKAFLKSIYYWIKRKEFDKFRKQKIKISEEIYDRESIFQAVSNYDIFIAGSDQIWNLECSDSDCTYFLDFVPREKKKYSYAASLGNYCYKKEERLHIQKLLSSFSKVSVREQSAATKMLAIGIENAIVHSDPVVLLEAKQWENIMKRRLIKKKYILVYLIQEDVNVMESAKRYAKIHNYKLISNKKSIEFILHNSPSDFLSWIYYSEAVFTNSFHGTIFSLIFDKLLAADVMLTNGEINNRILELLVELGAEHCILKENVIEVHKGNSIDSLSQMRTKAMQYLHSICEEVK